MSLILPAFDATNANDAVIAYVSAGLRPILVHAPVNGRCTCGQNEPEHKTGKHPVLKNWQKPIGLDALQDHLARLRFKPNIGLVLGEQQNGQYIVAVDVDDEARVAGLEAELGKLQDTVRCDSGRGYRLFYELGSEIVVDR